MTSNKLALVITNGCFLLAYRDESFVARLPDFQGGGAALLQRLQLPDMPVKQASHTHVPLFASIVKQLTPGTTGWRLLDVGGYIGAIGIPVARWAATQPLEMPRLVELYEPTQMSALIERSVHLNGLESMVAVKPYAASNVRGKAVFNNNENQRVAGHLGGAVTESSVMVETVTLDELHATVRGELVIAKIDTEGHEPKVLEGMRHLLDHNLCVAIVEFHEFCLGSPVGHQTYERFLFDRFRVFNVGNIGYPKIIEEIPDGDTAALRRHATRDGNSLTDLICFDRRLPEWAVDTVVRPYLGA